MKEKRKTKQSKKDKTTETFSARLPMKLYLWFLEYLKKNSIGVNTSTRFREFAYALKHKEIPQISVSQSVIRCPNLKRALTYFCTKCKTDKPTQFLDCPQKLFVQTELGVKKTWQK